MNLCEKKLTVCDYNEFKNRIEINYPKNYALECLNEYVIANIIEGIEKPSNLMSISTSENDSIVIYALIA